MAGIKPTDLRILDLLNAGQRDEAFTALFIAYRDKLHHLCAAYLRDPTMAEDALQESWLRIWRFLPKYDKRASLYTWIYQITRNQCATEFLRRPHFVSLTEDNGHNPSVGPIWGTVDPRIIVAQLNDLGQLQDLVDRLPERYRRVLVLYFYEDRSVREVAEMLGMPVGTVKTHLSRARSCLWEQLRRRGFGDGELGLEANP